MSTAVDTATSTWRARSESLQRSLAQSQDQIRIALELHRATASRIDASPLRKLATSSSVTSSEPILPPPNLTDAVSHPHPQQLHQQDAPPCVSCAHLRSKLDGVHTELENSRKVADRDLNELQAKLVHITNENQTLHRDLAESQRREDALKRTLTVMQQESEHVASRANEMLVSYQSGSMFELSALLKERSCSSDVAQQLLHDLVSECRRYQDELSEHRSKAVEQDTHIRNMHDELMFAKTALSDAQTRETVQIQRLEDAVARIHELEYVLAQFLK